MLKVAALTQEDQLAWLDAQLLAGAQLGPIVWVRSLMQDGKDATQLVKLARTSELPGPQTIGQHLIWATFGLPYWVIETLVTEWIES